MKRSSRTFFPFLFWTALLILPCFAAVVQAEIQDLKLKQTQLPRGWKLMSEVSVPEQKLSQLRARFSGPIDKVLYQNLKVDGKEEVRLNYLVSPSEGDHSRLYQRLIEMVGKNNAVVRKEKVLVEIISKEKRLMQAVVELLPLSLLQKSKLNPAKAPGHWNLTQEVFVSGKELEGFGNKFGTKLDEMINQFFLVNQKRMRINSLACFSDQDVGMVHDKMVSLVGGTNGVLRDGNLVMEIISENPDLKEEAKKLLLERRR